MNLRKYAQGKPCQIRLPGCVDTPDHETTVLCHFRSGSTGIGTKENDLAGAHGCFECHRAVDGERKIEGYTPEDIKAAFLEGILRTQRELISKGIVRW